MRRKKTPQKSSYDGVDTPQPVYAPEKSKRDAPEESDQNNSYKRQRYEEPPKDVLEPFFILSMKNRLKALIGSVFRKKKSTENDLIDLKTRLSNSNKLPTGIITDAARLAGCDILLMRRHLEHRYVRSNVDEWKAVIAEDFDNIVNSLKSNNTSSLPIFSNSSDTEETEEQNRVFTTSLNGIIRKDLPLDIKELVLKKISVSMTCTSDFIACFSSLIQMIINELKNCQFTIDDTGNISLCQAPGFNMTSILPQSTSYTEPVYTIQPLNEELFKSSPFDSDFSQLFTDQHLDLIFTQFFGLRGAKKGNMEKHPVQSAMFLALEKAGVNKQTFGYEMPCREAMSGALATFIVNFKNMWAEKKTINKLLDKVILVLLRLHLAETRESGRKMYILKKTPAKKQGQNSLKNHARLVCRKEEKKLKKLRRKMKSARYSEKEKVKSRIVKAEQRLSNLKETFKQKMTQSRENIATTADLLESEALPDEEEEPLGEDASRRRIGQLKSVVKHLIFGKSQEISEDDVKAESSNSTQKERSACVLIANCVKKFLPPKKKYHVIAYQMFFCIFANDVLKLADYSKFTRNLYPAASFSRINAFHLNATTLYQVMTQELGETPTELKNSTSSEEESGETSTKKSKDNTSLKQEPGKKKMELPTKLLLFSYERQPVYSLESARENKDAVFNSFFDMGIIQKKCETYGLRFGHRIVCLPGLKTVRVMGVTTKKDDTPKIQPAPTQEERALKNPSIWKEGQKSADILNAEVHALIQQVKELEADLKKTLGTQNDIKNSKKMKDLKKEWKVGSQEELYHQIQGHKEAKNEYYLKLNSIRRNLAESRQLLYFKQMALRYKTKLTKVSTPPPTGRTLIKKEGKGAASAKTRQLITPESFTFLARIMGW